MWELGTGVHTCNSSTQEAETKGSLSSSKPSWTCMEHDPLKSPTHQPNIKGPSVKDRDPELYPCQISTFLVFFFFLRVSLCSPEYFGIHSVDKTVLELKRSPCFCLPSAGITGVHHYPVLKFLRIGMRFLSFETLISLVPGRTIEAVQRS